MPVQLRPSRKYNEAEVKEVLAAYGIAVPRFRRVDPGQEVDPGELRYPLALKVCDVEILHKTEVGGVRLNLAGPRELASAARDMAARFPESSLLVEEMAPGGVELIVGLVDDATFGLCIMAGLGGVLAELYRDVAFRALPITRADAGEMLGELKGHALLEGFRGMEVDREAIIDLLLRVSRLGLEQQDVLEGLDLNPVIVHPQGLTVVDAKLGLKTP